MHPAREAHPSFLPPLHDSFRRQEAANQDGAMRFAYTNRRQQ
jgi:hypothetical protein